LGDLLQGLDTVNYSEKFVLQKDHTLEVDGHLLAGPTGKGGGGRPIRLPRLD